MTQSRQKARIYDPRERIVSPAASAAALHSLPPSLPRPAIPGWGGVEIIFITPSLRACLAKPHPALHSSMMLYNFNWVAHEILPSL